MKVVVVESPTKAKTIGRYLDSSYKVIASYGHVRNLISKDGSVVPEEGFSMKWDTDANGAKRIKEIKKALQGAEELILATDPDREGEAISWHLCQVLGDKLHGIKVSRIMFHEITKSAINNALSDAKNLDDSLIDAYLARCALDYLVGFKLSPILWRKLPGSRSAGRVQSVALRLVYERESEIEQFKTQEYWTITASFNARGKSGFNAGLSHFDGKKLDKFTISKEADAQKIVSAVEILDYSVSGVEAKDVKRNPTPPFITSTLQQEAARKLGFTAKRTMQVAQKLYEGMDVGGQPVGLITYMRTDSTNVSADAIKSLRTFIKDNYGNDYLPKSANVYSKKVKNAQEAHEAIRPTNIEYSPEKLKNILDRDSARLYSLIWKRALSSQMSSAVLTQMTVDVASADGKNIFHTSGSAIKFDGFLKLYEESPDDSEESVDLKFLDVKVGDEVKIGSVSPGQHFTQPPARYTEASIIKKLEELGIGRPSTYANIIFVLQNRKYIVIEKKRFFLQDLGRLVSVFLMQYFTKYVEYDFTANLEQELDDISTNKKSRIDVLNNFWISFKSTIESASKLRIRDVIGDIEGQLESTIFANSDGVIDKKCPNCSGTLGLRLGKFGTFVACSNYPECKFTKRIVQPTKDDVENFGEKKVSNVFGPTVVGKYDYNGTDVDIFLKQGPYGFYLEATLGTNVKRSSVPKFLSAENLDIDTIRFLISLPKVLGKHPDDGGEVSIGIGKFGPYVKHANKFASVKDFEEFKSLDLQAAISKLLKKKDK